MSNRAARRHKKPVLATSALLENAIWPFEGKGAYGFLVTRKGDMVVLGVLSRSNKRVVNQGDAVGADPDAIDALIEQLQSAVKRVREDQEAGGEE